MSTFDANHITPEFSNAFELLENTTKNIFLTGKAGTGKSTFLQYFRKNTKKKIAVVAPTGVAALNVQGQTIHAFFRLKPIFIDIVHLKPVKRPLFKSLELLIIDEISMVRADILDAIDHILRVTRKKDTPFGGVQICVIGDPFQLPPVVYSEEQENYAQHYRSAFFFDAKIYQAADFQTLQFDKVHRQHDHEFINILNAIRTGQCRETDLKTLNGRVLPKAVPATGTLVLTTTNALADDMNHANLAKLSGPSYTYKGTITGSFDVKGGRLPAPEALILKTHAQIMFVKNDSEGRWVNGTIGIVEKLNTQMVHIRVGEEIYKLEPETWKNISYELNEDKQKIVEKTLGTYSQFPFVLAWAITIHKSQGKTLDRVIIDLGGRGAFAAGQLYVALSRCRTLANIALKRPVTFSDIRCNQYVLDFMSRCTVGGLLFHSKLCSTKSLIDSLTWAGG